MQLCTISPPVQWLPLLLLAALSNCPLCHAERDALEVDTVTQTPPPQEDGHGSPESPKQKQPLYKTVAEVAEMLHGNNSGKTSFAEASTIEGSCAGTIVWGISSGMVGEGAYAEIFEVQMYDEIMRNFKTGVPQKYVLKIAKTKTDRDGNTMSEEDIVRAMKDVDAEAELLSLIHAEYQKKENENRCPNVVPVIAQHPCLYNTDLQISQPVSGAYITMKMAGDLEKWSKKYSVDPCRSKIEQDYHVQLMTGLDCLHEYAKIAHQDLKDDNILYDELDSNNCPQNLYIADLGLSEPIGKRARFFDRTSMANSYHLITDQFGVEKSNLGIQWYETGQYVKVWEEYDYANNKGKILPWNAVVGYRKLITSLDKMQDKTSRLIDQQAGVQYLTLPGGYTVDKRTDYCSFIYMYDSTFKKVKVKISDYDTPEKLTCGPMGKFRLTVYTGLDR